MVKGEAIASRLFWGVARGSRTGYGVEFVSLRDYVPGDDPRLVDWRASARRFSGAEWPGLVVREGLEDVRLHVLILVAPGPGSAWLDKPAAASAAAALIAGAARLAGDSVAAAVVSGRGVAYLSSPEPRVVGLEAGRAFCTPPRDPRSTAMRVFRAAGRVDLAILLSDYSNDTGFYAGVARLAAAAGARLLQVLVTTLLEHRAPRGFEDSPVAVAGGYTTLEGLAAAVEAHMARVEGVAPSVRVDGLAWLEEGGWFKLVSRYLAARRGYA